MDGPGSQLSFRTNADQEHVVRAFRHAFFDAPTLSDHFKPTPLGHFRAMLTWEPTQILDCPIAARLVEVSTHRLIEDAHNWRHEVGETIGLDCQSDSDGLLAKIFIDNRPLIGMREVSSPLVLHTYVHEMCSQLQAGGYTVAGDEIGGGYHVPPGAPPGWPFGAG